jgi:hypothetical protein
MSIIQAIEHWAKEFIALGETHINLLSADPTIFTKETFQQLFSLAYKGIVCLWGNN